MTRGRLSRFSLSRRLAVALLICAPLSARGQESALGATVYRSFDLGAGQGAVGVVDAYPDTEIEGPQAVFAGAGDEVYVLDQINGRVLRFEPKKPDEPTRALTLPEGVQPTDLVIAGESVYVWDGKPLALEAMGPQGALERSLSPTRAAAPDEATLSAFAQTGSETIDEEGATRGLGDAPKAVSRARQTVASHGRGVVVADLTPLKTSGVAIALKSKDGAPLAKLKMQVRSRIGAVEVLDVDRLGHVFVLGENIPVDSTDKPATFVARYAPTGGLEGVYELPLDEHVALSRRFVTVSSDGDVYFLRTRKGSVDLLGVGFRPLSPGQIIDLTPYAPPPSLGAGGLGGGGFGGGGLADFARRKGVSAAVRALSRTQVLATALQFATVRWRVNPGAYGPDPDRGCSGFNRIRRPGYLHGKLNQEVVGIPYCWGCHGSLPQIAALIGAGRLAGNVCTRNDPRPDVTGVDCSAFVSACWGLSTHFTTMAIPAIAHELGNPWDLLPGDALNKPGSHVMLFVGFTADRRAEVIESSTGGCNGKVCHNIYPLGSLLARGYRPVRYRGLINDRSAPSLVAQQAPAAPAQKPAGAPAPEPRKPKRR